jgi:hypothetical protein
LAPGSGSFSGTSSAGNRPPKKGKGCASIICRGVRLYSGATHVLATRIAGKEAANCCPATASDNAKLPHASGNAAPACALAEQISYAIQFTNIRNFSAGHSAQHWIRLTRRTKTPGPNKPSSIHIGIVGCLASFLDALSFRYPVIAVGFFHDHKSLTSPTLKTASDRGSEHR